MRPQPAAFAACLAALLFLTGCTQTTAPSSCSGLAGSQLSGCIYLAAVLDQNPYTCYSIPEGDTRTKCLRDASDSAMKSMLERLTPQERERLAGVAEAAQGQQPASQPPSAKQPSQQPAAPPQGASQPDSQAYQQATAMNDMPLCASISDASVRASCITQVALQVKNPQVCGALPAKEDFDLCRLYAKAGEQAK